MPRLLIVDDDDAVCASLALLLKQQGFETRTCSSAQDALALVRSGGFDLVLQDMNFSAQTQGDEGLALLGAIQRARPGLPVLLMTAWGSIELAVRGVKAGAANFFSKPWVNAQLVELIRTTLDLAAAPRRPCAVAREPGGQPRLRGPGRRTSAAAARAGHRGAGGAHARTVLILGESGTGKELIAGAHALAGSDRRSRRRIR
jgi:two-component system NtrC family response regulator